MSWRGPRISEHDAIVWRVMVDHRRTLEDCRQHTARGKTSAPSARVRSTKGTQRLRSYSLTARRPVDGAPVSQVFRRQKGELPMVKQFLVGGMCVGVLISAPAISTAQTREAESQVTVQGTVEAIDHASRTRPVAGTAAGAVLMRRSASHSFGRPESRSLEPRVPQASPTTMTSNAGPASNLG